MGSYVCRVCGLPVVWVQVNTWATATNVHHADAPPSRGLQEGFDHYAKSDLKVTVRS